MERELGNGNVTPLKHKTGGKDGHKEMVNSGGRRDVRRRRWDLRRGGLKFG